MKNCKSAIILSFVFIFSTHLSAQKIILKGGVTIADIHAGGEDVSEINEILGPKLGIQGGLIVAIPIAKELSIWTGGNYTQLGSKGTVTAMGSPINSFDVGYRFNYLQVPVLFTKSFEIAEDIKFFGQVGPNIGVAINAEVFQVFKENGEVIEELNEELNIGMEDGINRVDSGISVGFGVEFHQRFIFNFNYHFSVLSTIPSNEFSDDTLRNLGLNLSVGYILFDGQKNKEKE